MSSPPPPPRPSKSFIAPVRERAITEGSSVSKRASVPPPPPRASVPPPAPPRRETSQVSVRETPAVQSADDFAHSVHLDAQGNILAGNGKLEELASLAAYGCRLGSLVGRQLSFGDVTGMEVTLASGVIMLHRDKHGEIVCVKPRPHVNLVQLRGQLNL